MLYRRMKNNVPKQKLGRKRKLSDKDITDIKKSITDRDDELDSYSVDSLNEKLANSAGQFEPMHHTTNKMYTGIMRPRHFSFI